MKYSAAQIILVSIPLRIFPGEAVQVLALGVLAELKPLDGGDHSFLLGLREKRALFRQRFRFLVGPEVLQPP